MKNKMLFVWTAALCAVSAFADVKLDPVFSSDMMLQQECPVAFFGQADPNASVTVDFAGKQQSVQADGQGAWRAEFPAMKAGSANYTVKVSDGKQSLTLDNVIVGDVWICAGQSNMEMPIAKRFRRGWSARNCEQEVANANYPEIRCASQRKVYSHLKELPAQLNFNGKWVQCSPKVADQFSATAYFFIRALYQDLKYPVGFVNISWGGARIEPWISRQGYEAAGLTHDLELAKEYDKTDAELKSFEQGEHDRFRTETENFHRCFDAACASAKARCAAYAAADCDVSTWKPATEQIQSGTARWYRTTFQLTPETRGKDLTLGCMSKIADRADIYLNGKRVGGWDYKQPENQKRFAVNLTAADLNQSGDNVLTVRGEYYIGRSSRIYMASLIRATRLTQGKVKQPVNTGWKMQDEFVYDPDRDGAPFPRAVSIAYQTHQFYSNLYNGMVAPWTKLPVKGIIWYQGCSNAGQLHYYALHRAMINDWRTKWGRPDLPFLLVQLAGFDNYRGGDWRTYAPEDAIYALTRDIQFRMLQLPNTGIACAIDIGDTGNIHPANKQEIGRRLALEAERMVYGKNIVSRGPIFENAQVEGSAIRVSYSNAADGLKTSDGKAPNGFSIAGEDGKFVWASARLDGDTILVSCPEVPAPKYVRYAYANYLGNLNLQNSAGLPAFPFRSDAYPYANEK